ncbi:MAG: outer membrane protein assembly factor BamD [Nitrospiraceae bacterium]
MMKLPSFLSARHLCSLLAAAILVVSGCSSKPTSPNAQGKALSSTDEQIFIGDTIEKNYDPHVIIKRAEAFFDKDEYAEAAIELTHFMELHRSHALAPYAQYRLGEAYLKQARTIDRDPEPVQTAMAAFEKLRTDYPASAYDAQAVARIHDCKDWLAQTHMFVGKFYYRREAYLAAAHRFEAILKDYPEMNVAPDALYYLALSYKELGATDWAREQLALLSERFPTSPIRAEGDKLLAKLGGPLPVAVAKTDVDQPEPSQAEPGPPGLSLAALVLPDSGSDRATIPQIAAPSLPASASALQPNLTFCRLGAWC